MRVLNQSRIPNEVLAPIVRWVANRTKDAARKSFIHFTDGDDEFARRNCVVTADAYPKGGWRQGLDEKHFIAIHVPKDLFNGRTYPRSQRAPAEGAPTVTFDSWDEELAQTIAHELRHVAQFEAGYVPEQAEEEDARAEVDAEVFAAGLMDKYRLFRKSRFRKLLEQFCLLTSPDPNRGTSLAQRAKKVSFAAMLAFAACQGIYRHEQDPLDALAPVDGAQQADAIASATMVSRPISPLPIPPPHLVARRATQRPRHAVDTAPVLVAPRALAAATRHAEPGDDLDPSLMYQDPNPTFTDAG